MKRPLFLSMLVLISSILIDWYFGDTAWLLSTVPVIAVFIYFVYKNKSATYAIFIVFWIFGILAFLIPALFHENINTYVNSANEAVEVYGVVTGVRDTKTGKLRINVDVRQTKTSQYTVYEKYRVEAVLKTGQVTEIGNKVILKGKLEVTEGPRNPPGSFNPSLFYKTRKISFLMYPESIAEKGKEINFNVITNRLKTKMEAAFDDALPKDESDWMKASILGDYQEISGETAQKYKANGVYHIVVISGFHITILALAAEWLLSRFLPIKLSAVISIVLIVFYCILTGCGISTVRAVVTAIILISGRLLYRQTDAVTSTSLSAILLLLYEPLYLLDIGFLLSFSAVFSLCFLTEPINRILGKLFVRVKILHFLLNKEKFRYTLSSTLSVSIVITPITAYYFNYISVFGLIVNMLIIPTTAMITIAGFLIAFLGLFNTTIAQFLSGVVYFILRYYNLIFGVFSPLSFSQVFVKTFPFVLLCLFYVILFLGIKFILENKEKKAKYKKGLIIGILVFSAIFVYDTYKYEGVYITFFDVGQGDGCLIEDGENVYLIDGGGWQNREFGTNTGMTVILPYLRHKGIKEIDTAFVSHMDADHVTGVMELISVGLVNKVVLPMSDYNDNELFEKLEVMAYITNTEITYMQTGDSVKTKNGFKFTALAPFSDYNYDDINQGSLVIKFQYNDLSILFTGDIGFDGENKMMNENLDLSATILKLPHHGSKNSAGSEFLDEVNPELVIISVGKVNNYSHPSKEVMERIEDKQISVLSTAQKGAIIINIKNDHMKIKTMLK